MFVDIQLLIQPSVYYHILYRYCVVLFVDYELRIAPRLHDHVPGERKSESSFRSRRHHGRESLLVFTLLSLPENITLVLNNMSNKNAFQEDAYRPLIDRIPVGVGVPAPGEGVGGVCSRGGYLLQGDACSLGGGISQHAMGQTPPVDRMTHTCKNITLAQLRCGR